LLFEGDEAKEKESTHEIRTVKLHSKHWVRPFTAYAPFTTPDKLYELLWNRTDAPHVWWIGQIITYITKLQANVDNKLSELKSQLGFKHPIVGYNIKLF